MDSQARRLKVAASVTLDALATAGSYGAALWLGVLVCGWSFGATYEHSLLLMLVVPLWVVALGISGCYERQRAPRLPELAFRLLFALAAAHLMLAIVASYARVDFLSREVMLIFFVCNYGAIMSGRLLIELLGRSGAHRRTLVIGSGELARRLADALAKEEGRDVLGIIRCSGNVPVPANRVLGEIGDIRNILAEQSPVDEVAIALPPESLAAARPAILACEERGVAVRQLLLPLGEEPRKTTIEHVDGFSLMTTHPSAADAGDMLVKRIIDVVGSVVGLVLTTLIFPFVALAVKLTSRGPVLFKQKRVGLNGRIFTIHKFRTMVNGAHDMRAQLAHLNEARGPHFKIKNDPRLTRVGRLLRSTSIDELPQFWNVLKGDMSLVGPRPFPVEEVEKHNASYFRRLTMKPGITGVWQTNGRSEVKDFQGILRMDEDYIRNWSLWLDAKLLLKTIPAVVLRKGAV